MHNSAANRKLTASGKPWQDQVLAKCHIQETSGIRQTIHNLKSIY